MRVMKLKKGTIHKELRKKVSRLRFGWKDKVLDLGLVMALSELDLSNQLKDLVFSTLENLENHNIINTKRQNLVQLTSN